MTITINKFFVRRALFVIGALVAVSFILSKVFFAGQDLISGNASPRVAAAARATEEVQASAAPSDLAAVQNDALEWFDSKGDLSTWLTTDPAVNAVSFGNNAAMSVDAEGVCMFAQITDGIASPVTVDPSGQACTAQVLADAKTTWRMEETGANGQADSMATQLVNHGAQVASFHLKGTISGEPGRLGDIVDQPTPGVQVVERHNDRIVLEARIQATGGCARATVWAGGSYEPTPCF